MNTYAYTIKTKTNKRGKNKKVVIGNELSTYKETSITLTGVFSSETKGQSK